MLLKMLMSIEASYKKRRSMSMSNWTRKRRTKKRRATMARRKKAKTLNRLRTPMRRPPLRQMPRLKKRVSASLKWTLTGLSGHSGSSFPRRWPRKTLS